MICHSRNDAQFCAEVMKISRAHTFRNPLSIFLATPLNGVVHIVLYQKYNYLVLWYLLGCGSHAQRVDMSVIFVLVARQSSKKIHLPCCQEE